MIRRERPHSLEALIESANLPRWKKGWTDGKGRKKKGFWYFQFQGARKILTKYGAPQQSGGRAGNPGRTEFNAAVSARNRFLAEYVEEQASEYNRRRLEGSSQTVLVVDVLNYYIRHHLHRIKNTKERRRYCVNFATGADGGKNGIAPYSGFGKLPAEQLSHDHMNQWIAAHPRWGWAARKKAAGVIKTAFAFAREPLRMKSNPIERFVVKGGYDTTGTRRADCFTESEIKAIKAAASDSYRLFFEACLTTGARPGELAIATPKHVLEAGKGSIAIRLEAHEWKNGFRGRTPAHRTIPLPPELKLYVIDRRDTAFAEEPLFPNSQGNFWNQGSWAKAFKDARQKANEKGTVVRECLVPYCTRHTFITSKLRKGLEERVVDIGRKLAMICGTSEEEIRKTYDHVFHEFHVLEEVMSL